VTTIDAVLKTHDKLVHELMRTYETMTLSDAHHIASRLAAAVAMRMVSESVDNQP
jgi:hypothetical protein